MQFLNASSISAVTFDGTVTSVSFVISAKAPLPTVLTLPGIVTFTAFLSVASISTPLTTASLSAFVIFSIHLVPLNAFSPRSVSDAGIVTSSSELHPLKANAPILVMLPGIVTLLIILLSLNRLLPSALTVFPPIAAGITTFSPAASQYVSSSVPSESVLYEYSSSSPSIAYAELPCSKTCGR